MMKPLHRALQELLLNVAVDSSDARLSWHLTHSVDGPMLVSGWG